jgi:hypothetical protein
VKKNIVLIFLIASASILAIPIVNVVAADTDPVEYWAVMMIAGTYSSAEIQFSADAAYMYHVIHDHYDFDGICYLSNMPPPNPRSTNRRQKRIQDGPSELGFSINQIVTI